MVNPPDPHRTRAKAALTKTMKPFKLLMLAAALSCLVTTGTPAQSGRKKRVEPPAAGQGGGVHDAGRDGAQGDDKTTNTQANSSTQGDEKVYEGREVTQRARILHKPLPAYTREARSRRVRGTVRLRIILRADGRVDDHIEVLASLPEGLTEEAIRVAKLIEFEPAEKDGRKVSQYVMVEYGFNIY